MSIKTSEADFRAVIRVEGLKFTIAAQKVPPRTIIIAEGCSKETIEAPSALCDRSIKNTAAKSANIAEKFILSPILRFHIISFHTFCSENIRHLEDLYENLHLFKKQAESVDYMKISEEFWPVFAEVTP